MEARLNWPIICVLRFLFEQDGKQGVIALSLAVFRSILV